MVSSMVKAKLDRDSHAELLARAEKVFTKGMVDSLREEGLDFLEEGGEGSFIRDTEGNEYLDCDASAGTYNLGRRNTTLVDELRSASRQIDQGNFVMISEEKARLASRLSSFVPGDLECALFTVVRGEPIDAACKLARGATGRSGLVTVDGGHYGETGFALSLSERADKGAFGPLVPDVSVIPFGNEDAARRAIGRRTAAFLMEVVQAENGCRVASADYMRKIRRFCDRAGALLIIDETITGFGRTGYRFAFERVGVTPDILVLGEAMGGGLFPMTAIVFKRRLKAFFDAHPLIHLCTFGGHDVGCRVARRAMDEYERVRPWELARLRGPALKERLRGLVGEHSELVRSLEGEGLLLSMRLSSADAASSLCRAARSKGLVIRQGRIARDTVLVRPSLLVSEREAGQLVEKLESSLAELAAS